MNKALKTVLAQRNGLIGLIGLTGLIGVVLGAIAVHAQSEDQPPTVAAFGEIVDVQVVNLDVYVSDKKGRPVEGLTADDFELYVDGQLVELTNFSAVSGSDRSTTPISGPRTLRKQEPITSQVEPHNVVIYFDNLTLEANGRDRVLDAVHGFLETQLDPDARVMLIGYDRSLRVLNSFSLDRQAALVAVEDAAELPTLGARRKIRRRQAISEIVDIFRSYEDAPDRAGLVPCRDGFGDMLSVAKIYAGEVEASVARSIHGLTQLTTALAGLPGRKSLVYVGNGLELRAGLDVFYFFETICTEAASQIQPSFFEYDATPRLKRLVDHANSNDVTLYTLEAEGVRGSGDNIAEASRQRFRSTANQASLLTHNLQNPMFFLAEETGGLSVLNANRFEDEFARLQDDMSTYYSFGFAPPPSNADGRHWVKVKVDRPKTRLRYRRTYVDKPIAEKVAERTVGALVFGLETDPLGISFEVGSVEGKSSADLGGDSESRSAADERDDDKGRVTVPILVTVPLNRVEVIPGPEHHSGRLRLVLTARDEKQTLLPIREKLVSFTVPGDQALDSLSGSRQFEIGLDLLPGTYEVGLAVRDEIGSNTSYRVIKVTVGD